MNIAPRLNERNENIKQASMDRYCIRLNLCQFILIIGVFSIGKIQSEAGLVKIFQQSKQRTVPGTRNTSTTQNNVKHVPKNL